MSKSSTRTTPLDVATRKPTRNNDTSDSTRSRKRVAVDTTDGEITDITRESVDETYTLFVAQTENGYSYFHWIDNVDMTPEIVEAFEKLNNTHITDGCDELIFSVIDEDFLFDDTSHITLDTEGKVITRIYTAIFD